MYKITYNDVSPTEDPSEIAFHNMKVGDEMLNLNVFIGGQLGWIMANPTKNFQDLEKELRKRNFNTHLIARKVSAELTNYKLTLHGKDDPTEYLYECISSCRPKKYAMEELLKEWKSYDENLEALKYAGVVTIIDEKDIGKKNTEKISESNPIQLVSKNKLKVSYKLETVDETIDGIYTDAKVKYGKEPTTVLYGMSHSGGPIMAFVIDNVIISNIGICIEHDSSGNKIIRLVTITI